ncbi:MAG: DNA mismatch repair endonuclease MutL, partial [Armatimonadetes bacterium]|nr:DNA mismatch repair endonuclease MutL [Anaerolineae bacterium]
MTIELLPEQVIAQIAAGEVVERPASVIKELLENALDAGAATVKITANDGGQRLMRISDDGAGIAAEEVELAFARHATSKLRTVEDLQTIGTLGFRGEALSSIAAVSHISVTTRHHTQNAGTQLILEGGSVLQRQAVGAPVGTVIAVENLFYNTPARLKFQKKDTTERRHIAALITHYAMAYPDVRFILEQDGREVFRSSGSGQLADVCIKALSLDTFKRMVEVYGEHETVRVFGYTSAPDLYRSDRGRITLFVNGRYVQDTSLNYAVVQAYHTLLATGRYPIAVLMIQLPSQQVDVNVHPTKAEVRFSDPNMVFSAVQRAVREAVIAFAQTPELRLGQTGGVRPDLRWQPLDNSDTANGGQLKLDLDNGSMGRYPTQIAPPYQRHPDRDGDDQEALGHIPVGAGVPIKPRTLPPLRVIGQLGAMYIIAEGPAGMYLVDQHAAHERILYEQFMERHARQQTVIQTTLDAQTINFAPTEARLVEEHLALLHQHGFTLEAFGVNTFLIRGIPALLAKHDPIEIVRSVIDDLELAKQPGHASIEAKLIKQVCKRAAVKAGQILSHEEMQNLIRQLERCESPQTCPHGRPTMLHMTGDQL